jgi:D-xylose transport system substrate-binding protein
MKIRQGRALAVIALAGSLTAIVLPVASPAGAAGLTVSSFTSNYSTMFSSTIASVVKSIPGWKPNAAGTKLAIGVILPDEVTSTRYVEFDAPDLATAFTDAGLSTSEFNIQNAQGSDATEVTDAQAMIAAGAKVLLVDPLDSTTGAAIEKAAAKAGVKVIDYDRLTLGGSRQYYVSFNNVAVGTLIGQGMTSCLTSWKVKKPVIYVMYGATTDNNATLFGQGYNAVLKKAGFSPGEGAKSTANTINESTGTWTPSVALTDFQGAYSAHSNINAVVTPNDENAAPLISYLQSKGVKPKKIPFTGQDATLTGFQNILSGYQCGTVYKPIWLEAQAAATLAFYLAAGKTPPASLVNGTTSDTGVKPAKAVPSVLLKPSWVTAATIQSTVIKDNVINPVALCTNQKPTIAGYKAPTYAQDCKTYKVS